MAKSLFYNFSGYYSDYRGIISKGGFKRSTGDLLCKQKINNKTVQEYQIDSQYKIKLYKLKRDYETSDFKN